MFPLICAVCFQFLLAIDLVGFVRSNRALEATAMTSLLSME